MPNVGGGPQAPELEEEEELLCKSLWRRLTLVDSSFSFPSPSLLQKLVGDFFDFGNGDFAENLVGILRIFFGPAK